VSLNLKHYAPICPKGGKLDRFLARTNDALTVYREQPELRPQEDINLELQRLRKALEALSPDTRQLIESREYMSSGRSLWDFVGNSSLLRLENCIADDLNRFVRKDRHKRFHLIQNAAITFHEEGGEVTARVSSPFVDYIHNLAEDVGLDLDAPKAVRDFLSKTET